MKNHLLISLVFFFWILHLPTWSQMQLPQKSTVQHNDASRPCIRAIVHPEPKPLKKAWKDYLKETHDFKIRGIGFLSNKDLLSAEKVVVERISKKEMDFYTKIVGHEEGSEMKVFAAYGYDIYIGPEKKPREFAVLKRTTLNFLQNYLPKYHEDLIKGTEKKIKELENEREDLKKQIKKNKKEISELNKDIKSLNKELNSNESELRQVEQMLKTRENQMKRVQQALDSN